MCVDPATGIMIGSTLLSAAGAAVEGINAGRIGQYNADVARVEAERQREVGRLQEQQAREAITSDIARQRQAIARAGVSLGSPTSIDLGADAANAREMHLQGIRTASDARARGLDTEAQLSELEARSARIRGFGAAGATLLQGASAWTNAGGDLLPDVGKAKKGGSWW